MLASVTVPLGQQHHLGGLINAPGVAVAQPITPSQSSAEEEEEEDEGEEVKAKGENFILKQNDVVTYIVTVIFLSLFVK